MKTNKNLTDKNLRDYLAKVARQLKQLGINLNYPIYDVDGGNSCFMKGLFASYSINSLIKFWCQSTGRKYQLTKDNNSGN